MSTLQELHDAWTQEHRAKFMRAIKVKGVNRQLDFTPPYFPNGRARHVVRRLVGVQYARDGVK